MLKTLVAPAPSTGVLTPILFRYFRANACKVLKTVDLGNVEKNQNDAHKLNFLPIGHEEKHTANEHLGLDFNHRWYFAYSNIPFTKFNF